MKEQVRQLVDLLIETDSWWVNVEKDGRICGGVGNDDFEFDPDLHNWAPFLHEIALLVIRSK